MVKAMGGILVVGSLNMDLVAAAPHIPAPGETIIGTRFFTSAGGKGANQAFAAGRLGGQVRMIGKVGDDDLGQQLRASLSGVGCDVSRVESVAGHSGTALIMVSDAGENCIVVAPGANAALTAGDIASAHDAFEATSVLLLQLESPLEAVMAAAAAAKAAGALVILDPAPAPAEPLPEALLNTIDIITPNESEAAALMGTSNNDAAHDDPIEVARALRGQGIPTVILKLGARGCYVLDSDGEGALIPAPAVEAVDSTAAGDTFNGALAVSLSEGEQLVPACRFAVKAAAVSVTRFGAQSSMPSRDELQSG
jgi:ribokinase